jgi:NADH-quinone oxidoreductase subunit C
MSDALFDRVRSALGALAQDAVVSHGVLVVNVAPDGVLPLVRGLKSAGFDMFLDVTAVDWLGQVPRFEVVWHFYSTTYRVRVRVKTRVTQEQPEVDSLTPLYGSAAFMERECHEMYGIRFRGNDDLRPILLYEGFVGYPLRKDYAKEQEQPLVPYREGFQ